MNVFVNYSILKIQSISLFQDKSINEAERQLMYRHILNSIADSESIYLECLSVSLQYMKAMKVTLATPQPVIPKEDFDVIFFKIPELHEFHYHFHESLKKQVCVKQENIHVEISDKPHNSTYRYSLFTSIGGISNYSNCIVFRHFLHFTTTAETT